MRKALDPRLRREDGEGAPAPREIARKQRIAARRIPAFGASPRFDPQVINQYHFGTDSRSPLADIPMLRVSRLTDYATVVMTCIAAHPDDVLSTAQIADETRLELPTVSKLLKSLGHAGLVESFRGVNGGYRLARPAGEITLAQIVEALEGPIGMTECSLAEGQCERESQCGVRANWQHVNSVVDSALRAVSLSDMLKPPSRRIDIHPIG